MISEFSSFSNVLEMSYSEAKPCYDMEILISQVIPQEICNTINIHFQQLQYYLLWLQIHMHS